MSNHTWNVLVCVIELGTIMIAFVALTNLVLWLVAR